MAGRGVTTVALTVLALASILDVGSAQCFSAPFFRCNEDSQVFPGSTGPACCNQGSLSYRPSGEETCIPCRTSGICSVSPGCGDGQSNIEDQAQTQIQCCTIGGRLGQPGSSFINSDGNCITCPGQIQACHSDYGCQGDTIELSSSSAPEQARECCLQTAGLSYSMLGQCMDCLAMGFLNTTLRGIEQGPGYSIGIGYIKRPPTFSQVFRGRVQVLEGGTASSRDFGFNSDLYTVRDEIPGSVVVQFTVDTLAQEEDETVQIQLTINPGFPIPPNLFLQDMMTLEIIDSDIVIFQFPENDYRTPEQDEMIRAVINKNLRIANPVTFQVFPFTVQQAEERSLVTEALNVPPDDNLFSPNRARIEPLDRRDFSTEVLTITFLPDENTEQVNDMPVVIQIANDDIDEADEEVFVIYMDLTSSVNRAGVQIDRETSLCRINDDDVIRIGFQNSSYTFDEPEFVERQVILLEKEAGVITEQTYRIIIQSNPTTPDQNINAAMIATMDSDNDYMIAGIITGNTFTPLFLPDQQTLPIDIDLFGDQIAEGLEAFQLISNPDETQGVPAFEAPEALFQTTFINIADDDTVTVGFEQNYTVSEDIGTFEVCFGVIFPPADVDLTINIDLVVDTVAGTAGEMDYTPISSLSLNVLRTLSATARRACFDVTIATDNVYETTEQFSLALAFDITVPQNVREIVTIDPSVVYVDIEDATPLTIGFINLPYSSMEGSLLSTFQVGVIGETELDREVTVDFATFDQATGGGRNAVEGLDYNSRSTSLTFGSGVSSIDVDVTLIEDGVFELTETFGGRLSVATPVDRLTLGPNEAEASIVDDDTLVVGYAQQTYQFNEESGENQVALNVAGDPGAFTLNVNYGTIEFGSGVMDAQGDLDYESENDTISISSGQTSSSHRVVILSDDIAEFTESFGIELSDSSLSLGGNLVDLSSDEADRISLDPSSATVEILSEDVARIGFVQTSYQATEGAGVMVDFGIAVLEGNLGVPVEFTFSTEDSTATAADDYFEILLQDITFDSAMTSTVASVTLRDDGVYENTESFAGVLTAGSLPSFVTLDPDRATAEILDNDLVTIGFRVVSFDVSEDAGPAEFAVAVLDGEIAPGVDFQVEFSTMDGSAIADGDYTSLTETLTFNSGSLSQLVSAEINNDDIFEDSESFTGNLRLIGSPERVVVAPDVATATILDQDTLTIGFQVTAYSVTEGDVNSVALLVGVLEGELGRNLDIEFNTQDGTAVAGSDYMAVLNEILQFAPGNTDFSIPVFIINDAAVEPQEMFQGLLTDPLIDRLTVAPSTADVLIGDTDTASIGFDRTVYSVVENEVFSNVTIQLFGVINTPVTVRLTTRDGSAVSIGAEPDFVSHDMEYTFEPGGPTEITVPIRILDDLLLEDDEGLNTIISLTTDSTAIDLDPAEAEIRIIDDDNVVIGFDQTLYRVTEGPGASVDVVVRVLMGELRREVVVDFNTEPGTASEGDDYTGTTRTLTFDQSTGSATINIPIVNDNVNEILERFRGVLTTSDPDVVLAPNVTTIEIVDNNPVQVSYRLPVYMFSEDMGVGVVCVDKIGATTQTITVIASGPLHGSGLPGMEVLTFAPDETEQCFDFTVQDDNIALEMTETLTWGLTIDGDPGGVELGDNPSTDILILDDDILTITVNKAGTVPESSEDVETCLIFSNPFAQEFSLSRATQLAPNASLPDDAGSAEAGSDYEANSDGLTIRPEDGADGQFCFNVTVIDDLVVEEPLECFGVMLALPDSEVLRDSIILNGGSLVCCIQDDDTVNIGFDPIRYEVDESTGEVFVTVRVLDGILGRQIEGVVTTEDGSATSTAPVDYINPGSITVQFDSVQQEQTLRIDIMDDDIFENVENFFANLASFDSAVRVTVPQAEILIREDNDEPTIGFVPAVYSVREDAGTVIFNVEVIRGTLERDVQVNFVTASGSATEEAPADYVGTTTTLLFTPTISSVQVPVGIINDSIVEADEMFTGNLGLVNPGDALLTPDVATVTILGDDPNDRVVIGLEQDYEVTEGGTVMVCARIESGAIERNVEVTLSTASGTAIDGVDYGSLSEVLVFTPDISRACAELEAFEDDTVEGRETLTVNLETEDPQADLDPDTATVDIIDVDVILVGLEETEYSVDEDEGSLEVCAVIIGGQLARALDVTLTSADGTAIAPGDYGSVSQTLTFMDTDDVVCVNITIAPDNIYEFDETFTVTVATDDSQAVVDSSREVATVTIVDEDELTIGFDPDVYSISEDGGSVRLCARILNGDLALEREVSVEATTSMADPNIYDNPATSGEDFEPATVTLTFNSANTENCFMVDINRDDLAEGSEVFIVNIETDAPRVTLDPDRAVVTILDADDVVIGYRDQPYVFPESGQLATVRVVLANGALDDDLIVNIQTEDIVGAVNAATSGVDYLPVNMDLTFGPGVTSISVNITLIDDTLFELDEIFNTLLTVVTQGIDVGFENDQPVAQVEIENDDIVRIGFEQTVYMTNESSVVEVCARVADDSPAQLAREVTVRFTTSDGTAIAPADYQAVTRDLVFSPDMTRVCVEITTEGDDIVEGNERFTVTLTTDEDNIDLNPDEAEVIIQEADVVSVTFERPNYTFLEDGVTGSVVVLKTGDTQQSFQVLVQGGPSVQTDIERSAEGINEVITFEGGPDAPDSITVTFALTDDSVALEAVEQYTAALTLQGNPSGVELGMFPTTDINVLDNDDVTVGFGVESVTVNEETDDVFNMCVVLDRRALQDVTVTIRSDPVTATDGEDYDSSTIPTTVTVSAGDDRTCFTGDIINDQIALEPTESFTLTITSISDPRAIPGIEVTEIFIVDTDNATVRFEQPRYSFSEDIGTGQVCLIKETETVTSFMVQVATAPGTATAGADYDPGPYSVTFGTAPNDRQCIAVGIVTDSETEDPENFMANIVIMRDNIVPGTPSTAEIIITDTGVQVNDTAIGDPLMTVPLLVSEEDLAALDTSQISLCYEIHGKEDQYFNLVTDECASVNAHYVDVSERLNVIGQIGVRATDENNRCRNILVDVDECSAEIDGVPLDVNGRFMEGGISVRRYANRVRISVPNCNELSLVMWVFCESRTLDDPEAPNGMVEGKMIKFVVMRGLNFGHRMAHGLIGQFWNIPARITPFTGLDRNGDPQPSRYVVNITGAQSGEHRAFTGWYYPLTWEFEEGPCLYVGNLQGGPIYEVTDPNDSVIEGTYKQYMVQNAFSEEEYDFGLFNEDRCSTDTSQ